MVNNIFKEFQYADTVAWMCSVTETRSLSVFDHFLGLALKGLTNFIKKIHHR